MFHLCVCVYIPINKDDSDRVRGRKLFPRLQSTSGPLKDSPEVLRRARGSTKSSPWKPAPDEVGRDYFTQYSRGESIQSSSTFWVDYATTET